MRAPFRKIDRSPLLFPRRTLAQWSMLASFFFTRTNEPSRVRLSTVDKSRLLVFLHPLLDVLSAIIPRLVEICYAQWWLWGRKGRETRGWFQGEDGNFDWCLNFCWRRLGGWFVCLFVCSGFIRTDEMGKRD